MINKKNTLSFLCALLLIIHSNCKPMNYLNNAYVIIPTTLITIYLLGYTLLIYRIKQALLLCYKSLITKKIIASNIQGNQTFQLDNTIDSINIDGKATVNINVKTMAYDTYPEYKAFIDKQINNCYQYFIKIIGDKNIIPLIKVTIHKNTLTISQNHYSCESQEPLQYQLFLFQLNSISLCDQVTVKTLNGYHQNTKITAVPPRTLEDTQNNLNSYINQLPPLNINIKDNSSVNFKNCIPDDNINGEFKRISSYRSVNINALDSSSIKIKVVPNVTISISHYARASLSYCQTTDITATGCARIILHGGNSVTGNAYHHSTIGAAVHFNTNYNINFHHFSSSRLFRWE